MRGDELGERIECYGWIVCRDGLRGDGWNVCRDGLRRDDCYGWIVCRDGLRERSVMVG